MISDIFNPIIDVFIEQYNQLGQLLENYLSPTINNVAGELSEGFWFVVPRVAILLGVIWLLILPFIRLIIGLINNILRHCQEKLSGRWKAIKTSRIGDDGIQYYLIGRTEFRKLEQIKSWNQGTILSSAKKGKYGKSNDCRILSIHTSRECRDWLYNLGNILKHWDKIEYIVEIENYLE